MLGLGCSEGHATPAPQPVAPPPPPPVPSPEVAEVAPAPPPPEPVTPATDADWIAFRESLSGRLVRPGDGDYGPSHQLFDPSFDAIHPAGIAFCATEDDVQRSVAFARAHGLPFTARCGGHSYAGYSTCEGLVCDVGPLSGVEVDRGGGTAVVGAGARLIDVYEATGAHGLAIPGGTCASVGISGLALGGGQGVLGRRFGLTSDNVTALRIVTADGAIRTCDARENADLLWASRGGGGGNFGVVTSFTFRAHPIGELTRFSQSFTWAAAGDVIPAWQEWATAGPDVLWSAFHVRAAGTRHGLSVGGVYAGPEAELRPLLAAFRARIGAAARRPANVITASYLDTMRVEAGCSERTFEECHLPTVNPRGQLGRRGHVGFSDIYDRPLSSAGVAALVLAMEARGTDPRLARGAGGVAFDTLGGAINRVAPDATAFVHRHGQFIAQCSTHWPNRASDDEIAGNREWLAHLRAAMRPHASGFAYQNYIDRDLRDWQRAYYGENLARLRRIKGRYDPDQLFRFAQSIPPA